MRVIDADKLNIYDVSPADGFVVMGVTEEDIDLAPTIKTKQVKYFDDDENVWKVGEVIVSDSEKPNNSKVSEIPTGSERSSE